MPSQSTTRSPCLDHQGLGSAGPGQAEPRGGQVDQREAHRHEAAPVEVLEDLPVDPLQQGRGVGVGTRALADPLQGQLGEHRRLAHVAADRARHEAEPPAPEGQDRGEVGAGVVVGFFPEEPDLEPVAAQVRRARDRLDRGGALHVDPAQARAAARADRRERALDLLTPARDVPLRSALGQLAHLRVVDQQELARALQLGQGPARVLARARDPAHGQVAVSPPLGAPER